MVRISPARRAWRTRLSPSTSSASVRQSRRASLTSGWSGGSISPLPWLSCQQVLCPRPLDVRRNTAAALVARQGQSPRCAPAKARAEQRRLQNGLDQDRLHRVRVQELEDLAEREAVLLTEREQDAVVRRRRLELEIEGAAEPLAQRESPGAGDPSSEGGVQNELHPAGRVEESLGDGRARTG